MDKIDFEEIIEEIQDIRKEVLINRNYYEYLVIENGKIKAKINVKIFEIIDTIVRFADDIIEAEIEAKDGNILKKDGKWEIKSKNKIESFSQDLDHRIWTLEGYKEIKINFKNAEIEIKNSKIVKLCFEFDKGAVYSFNENEEINTLENSIEIFSRVSISGTVEQAQRQLEKEDSVPYTEPLIMFKAALNRKINCGKE